MNINPEEAYLRLRYLFQRFRITPQRDPEVAARARDQFLARVDALGPPRPSVVGARSRLAKALAASRSLAWAVASILLAVALLLGGTGVAYASQNALPAEPLYPVKIAIEDLQLSLSSDEAVDAYLLLQFIQRRVNEMTALVGEERFEYISIPVARYNDSLLQLATIIIGYLDRDDPRAQELISLLSEALTNHEIVLSTLLETVPASASSDIELAIHVSKEVSQSAEIAQVETSTTAEFRGILDSLTDQGAVVCGIAFSFTSGSDFEGSPIPGDAVKVEFGVAGGRFFADKVEREDEQEECELRVQGLLSARGDGLGGTPWVVAGIEFLVDPTTELRGDPQVGDFIRVRAVPLSDGRFLAARIETEVDEVPENAAEIAEVKNIEPDKGQRGQTMNVEITGESTHFSAASVVTFSPAEGIIVNSIIANSPTSLIVNLSIASTASLGDRQVIVITQEEVASRENFRIEEGDTEDTSGEGEEVGEVKLIDADPDKGQQGQTLAIVIIGEGTHFDLNSHVSLGTGITVNSISIQSSTRLTINVSIASNAALGDRGITVATGSEVAGGKEFRVESATTGESGGGGVGDNGGNDGGQEPDAVEEVRFTGTVQSMSSQIWMIGGKQVVITPQTEIKDNINVGDLVEVRALLQPDGSLVAARIELADS